MRNSRMELLRIIGMYFIVLTHESAFGIRNLILPLDPQDMTFNVCVNYVLNFPGTAFNLIFIILAGYYGISRTPSRRRVAVLALQECFYAWIPAIILFGGGFRTYGRKDVLQAAFPLFTGYNWFINCYIVLMLLAPFLNKMIRALSKQDLLRLIIILFGLRVLSAVAGWETYVVVGRNLEEFIFCYLIGAFLRLYPDTGKSSGAWAADAALVTVVYSLSLFAMGYMFRVTGAGWYMDHMTLFLEPAKILAAVCIFQAFTVQRPFRNSRLNRMAGYMPGVYLIHENRLLRPCIWKQSVPTLPLLHTLWFVPGMMLKAAVVMLICMAVHVPWKRLIEPGLLAWLEHIAPWCSTVSERLNERFLSRLSGRTISTGEEHYHDTQESNRPE